MKTPNQIFNYHLKNGDKMKPLIYLLMFFSLTLYTGCRNSTYIKSIVNNKEFDTKYNKIQVIKIYNTECYTKTARCITCQKLNVMCSISNS